MSDRRLRKIEEMLAALEHAVTPDVVVVRQRPDGSWPLPDGKARLVIERMAFRASPERQILNDIEQRQHELQRAQRELEAAQARLHESDIAVRVRTASERVSTDAKTLGVAGVNR